MTVLMMLANYTFILPLYMKILNFDLGMSTMKYLVVGVLPFNVIKGIIVSTVFVLVYKKLIPWLILKQGFGNENQIIKNKENKRSVCVRTQTLLFYACLSITIARVGHLR